MVLIFREQFMWQYQNEISQWDETNEKPGFIFPQSLIYMSTVMESEDQM